MAHREKLFEYLRTSKLYTVAAEDIEALISYMGVHIQDGSLAHMFGFKRMQIEFEDELPWLAGNPSWASNPSLEDAAIRVKEMRETYEKNIMALMLIR